MAGDDVVSAIPSELTNWSGWAAGQNADLERAARDLNQKLEALNFSRPDPNYLGQVPYAGNDVVKYAYRNDATDTWVGQVGHAFLLLATRGLPGGLVRADLDGFRNSLVTTNQQDLARMVGGDPVARAEAQAGAAALAEQMKEAVDSGDKARQQELVRELESHMWDPDFTSTFFQSLGVDYTIEVAGSIRDDDHLLYVFDNALATATNAPDWDPAFNDEMWPPPGKRWISPNYDQVRLLKYGVFSEDFLTRAGDNILFGGRYSWNNSHDPFEDQMVLAALSRNPQAAMDYLLGHAPNPEMDGQPSFQIRMANLLFRGSEYEASPEVASALGDLISAAGRSPDARRPFVGPDGTEPEFQVLLHVLGEAPKSIFPDGARAGLADLIAQYIDSFVDAPLAKDGKPTWQQNVFDLAEEDSDQQIVQDNLKKIEQASVAWSLEHMPKTDDASDNQNVQDWITWEKRIGNLFALSAMPLGQRNYDRTQLESDRVFAIDQIIYFATSPGGPTWVVVDDIAGTLVDNWQHNGNPFNGADYALLDKAKDNEVFLNKLADMKQAMTAHFVQSHPEWWPPELKDGHLSPDQWSRRMHDFVLEVANGENTGIAHISRFQEQLNAAAGQFAEQYFFPKK